MRVKLRFDPCQVVLIYFSLDSNVFRSTKGIYIFPRNVFHLNGSVNFIGCPEILSNKPPLCGRKVFLFTLSLGFLILQISYFLHVALQGKYLLLKIYLITFVYCSLSLFREGVYSNIPYFRFTLVWYHNNRKNRERNLIKWKEGVTWGTDQDRS